jgi:hypothetical protein
MTHHTNDKDRAASHGSSYVPPQQLTPGGPVHGGFTFTESPRPDSVKAPFQPRTATAAVLREVADERQRQDEKWGEQNHPILWPSEPEAEYTRAFYERMANEWKRENAERVATATALGVPRDRNCAWDGIAIEELCEAFAESDPTKVRAEAVQATAVLVAMIECIDRTAS